MVNVDFLVINFRALSVFLLWETSIVKLFLSDLSITININMVEKSVDLVVWQMNVETIESFS